MKNCRIDSTLYLLSGPCGVGKSTISKEVAKRIPRSVLLVGDNLLDVYQGYDAPWEERLSLAWTNILNVTRNFICHRWSVALDFVVEDELEWFMHELEVMSVILHYIVLVADEPILLQRINHRGTPEITERSLFLLNKLKKLETNSLFLYDTSDKSPTKVTEDILSSNNFRMPPPPHVHKGALFQKDSTLSLQVYCQRY